MATPDVKSRKKKKKKKKKKKLNPSCNASPCVNFIKFVMFVYFRCRLIDNEQDIIV